MFFDLLPVGFIYPYAYFPMLWTLLRTANPYGLWNDFNWAPLVDGVKQEWSFEIVDRIARKPSRIHEHYERKMNNPQTNFRNNIHPQFGLNLNKKRLIRTG